MKDPNQITLAKIQLALQILEKYPESIDLETIQLARKTLHEFFLKESN